MVSAGWADITATVMESKSGTLFGCRVESNVVVGREAGSEVVAASASVYLKGHAFEVLIWPNAWHLLHLLDALAAASTPSNKLGSRRVLCFGWFEFRLTGSMR